MSSTNMDSRGRRRAIVSLSVLAVALTASPVEAQTPIGVPYIGSNHLGFYTTELSSDGVAPGMSRLYGGRYGHRFGAMESPGRFSLLVQVAGHEFDGGNDDAFDVALGAYWTRTLTEIDPRLQATAGVGVGALVWGFGEVDTGRTNVSIPVVAGLSYDIPIGRLTLAPFISPGLAWVDRRQYVDDVRIFRETDWDVRFTTGASLRMREVVLTTSRIRGEHGLPQRSRWAFAAGVSF